MINPSFPKVWFGGDYNPDQWPRAVWEEDMRLFKQAGIDVATLPVFSWALLQPDEERYDFTWLDEALDLLHQNGLRVVLATSTAVAPAWMARRHPDVLRVDFEGHKRAFGFRHNACPHSPTYRAHSARLAGKLAERYKAHPALVAWHISNEYGGYCYCERCAAAFREWLRRRYGSIAELNERWSTRFWGHTFYDWNEIVPPNMRSEFYAPGKTVFQPAALDYARFQSDSLLECYALEYAAIKAHTPALPVTTNLMGTFKELDYFAWAKQLDVVSWDSYPAKQTHPADTALRHDLMRGLKGGQPFMLMEQAPSQVNWDAYCALKRPGVMRLQSYQAVAHGADTVMFFQLRQSQGSNEKFHSAVISHTGDDQTRTFREVAALGAELGRLGDAVLDARTPARVAILFDWQNWWALEYSAGPSQDFRYIPQIEKWYRACWRLNIPVDFVSPEMPLDGYAVVLAPAAYMLREGWAERVEAFVEAGGTFLTTFNSGLVDENDRVVLGGYPGDLRRVLGVWHEEFDALLPEERVAVRVPDGALAGTYEGRLICNVLHCETAEAVGTYGSEFYAGTPALTRNRFGHGEAWYVGTDVELALADRLVRSLCTGAGVAPVLATPEGVEATQRVREGRSFTFVLNHNEFAATVELGPVERLDLVSGQRLAGSVALPGRGVWILVVAD